MAVVTDVYIPQILYVEILTLRVIVLGGWSLWGYLDHENGVLMKEIVPI